MNRVDIISFYLYPFSFFPRFLSLSRVVIVLNVQKRGNGLKAANGMTVQENWCESEREIRLRDISLLPQKIQDEDDGRAHLEINCVYKFLCHMEIKGFTFKFIQMQKYFNLNISLFNKHTMNKIFDLRKRNFFEIISKEYFST